MIPRPPRTLAFVLAGLLGAALLPGSAAAQHHGASDSTDHYSHGFEHPERYADEWNDPARDDWQKPDRILGAMGLEPGMTVADLGTGTGYFVPHLSAAVGTNGRVKAVDIEPAMLRYVAGMAAERGLGNVDTVRAAPTDTHLGPASVDRILTVNTWHHIPDREAYAEHLAARLKEGGSVWVVDFEAEAPMGPPRRHRLAPQAVVDELERGGLEAEVRDLGLAHQYVVVGRN
ncbi:MAG: class I SAM-dependent methyltransferase [Salinivenus sp.]